MKNTRVFVLSAQFLAVASLLAGCGDGADDGDTGGTGSGGVIATGGTGSGGTDPGAGGSTTSGETGTGGEPQAGHCSPGFTTPGSSLYPGIFDNCESVDGVTNPEPHSYRDILVSEGVGPGRDYAFSAEMNVGADAPFVSEIYGADDKCGPALELLDTVTITGPGTLCHHVQSATNTYEHLIWVWTSGAEQLETGICDDGTGTCPVN